MSLISVIQVEKSSSVSETSIESESDLYLSGVTSDGLEYTVLRDFAYPIPGYFRCINVRIQREATKKELLSLAKKLKN